MIFISRLIAYSLHPIYLSSYCISNFDFRVFIKTVKAELE